MLIYVSKYNNYVNTKDISALGATWDHRFLKLVEFHGSKGAQMWNLKSFVADCSKECARNEYLTKRHDRALLD